MTMNTGREYARETASIPGSRSRVLQLDILRGMAILLVIAAHSFPWLAPGGLLAVPAHFLVRMGWSGVDLFFVLSGFLIGNMLFSEIKTHSTLNVKRFLIRRGFKIWPMYVVYLLYVAIVLMWRHPDHAVASAWQGIWPNLLHVQNYFFREPRLYHTWSLAVEEHFYLALPFILWLCWQAPRMRKGAWIPVMALTLTLVCTLARIYSYRLAGSPGYFEPSSMTHLRIDALFWGVMLAYCYTLRPHTLERFVATSRRRAALFVVGLVCILPALGMKWGNPFLATFGITLIYIGYGCILLALVHTPVGRGRGGRLLAAPVFRGVAWIGFYSYPIYMWHMEAGQKPVLWLSNHHFLSSVNDTARWWCLTLLFALFATLTGVLFSLLIERPTLALRDKLFPSMYGSSAKQPVPQEAVISGATISA